MADGYLNFDTKINTSGFYDGIKNLGGSLDKLKNQLKNLAETAKSFFSISKISDFANEVKSLWNIQLEAETKLETVLGRNLGATQQQINSVKEWSSELQNIGVIGDEIQLAGLQEISTYIENADSLKTMNVVLNDMLAQQYGLNATTEEAVTISTMLGKVLAGQTSALSRYGYTFTEAQEQLLKYGTEEQRVATLAEVVEASVGGMNEALAKTPAGRLKQVSNTVGDIKEQFGKAVTNIEAMFIPALENMAHMLEKIAALAVKVSESLAAIFGMEMNNSAEIGVNISESVDTEEELSEAVEETVENQEKSLETAENSLASFDKLNILVSKTADEPEDEKTPETVSETVPVSISPSFSDSEIEKATDTLSDKIQKLIEPIKLAWDANSSELVSSLGYAADKIKGFFRSIAGSFEEVWTNGSGERYVGNIIRLFSDFFKITGDISAALETAWNDGGRGTALIQSYFDRWNSLLELVHEISWSFSEAWNDGTGVEICGNIFEILTNINEIYANLRTNFKNAWSENQTGVKIWSAILTIVNTVFGTVNSITDSTKKWAEKLDFSPLLESVQGLLEGLEPLTQNISSGISWLWENVLLPIATWTLEDAVPAFLDLLSAAIGVLNSVIEAFKPFGKWLWEKFLKPLGQWTGKIVTDGIESLADALKNIGDWIRENPNASLIIGGLAGAFVALSKAIAGGTFAKLGSSILTFGKTLATLDVTVGVIAAGIVSWGYVITELSNNWTDICEVFEESGGVFGFISGWLEYVHEDVEEFFSFGEFGESWCEFWESAGAIVYNFVEFLSGLWDTAVASTMLFIAEIKGAWDNFKSLWQTGLNEISEFFTGIWNGIVSIFEGIPEWFNTIFSLAWELVKDAWSGVKKFFGDLWEDVKSVFKSVGKFFKDKFNSAYKNIKDIFFGIKSWFSQRWEDVRNVFENVSEWFGEKFDSAYSEIKNVFGNVSEWFKEKFTGAFSEIQNVFSEIGNWFSQRWEDIQNVFSSVDSWFGETWSEGWNKIKEVFSIEKISSHFSSIWETIKGVFSHVSNWFGETFSSSWQAVKDVFSKGGEIFTGITDGIYETFKTIVNGLIDGINSVISVPLDTLNEALWIFREWELWTPWGDFYPFEWIPEIPVPQIPHLAQGTVVPANYGEFLAVLGDNKHETEIVSPESTIEAAVTRAMQKNGGISPKEIVVNTYLYPNSSAYHREIISIVNNDRLRRGG